MPLPTSTVPPALAELIAGALQPRNFFVASGHRLELEFLPRVATTWEIYHGRLLGPSQTRCQAVFDTWNLHHVTAAGRPDQPLLSLKLDGSAGLLHVTRALECWVWEPYDAGDNVILSREVRKGVPELVGTIVLAQFPRPADLRSELRAHLFQAVVGCSRLPLTSSEAPLPAFTLGQVGYVPGAEHTPPSAEPEALLVDRLAHTQTWSERARLLELVLRSTPTAELENVAGLLSARWALLGSTTAELMALFRTVVNEVALSPYTDFVDRMLALLRICVAKGYLSPADLIDFLSYVLRQLGRHLTAYDLITFHHRGANYPDALLLDAALKLSFELLEQQPACFLDGAEQPNKVRLRRRALRQGWLLRRQYEGLPVPDQPTSPGENLRVLPPPFVRVPEEQILDPARRPRRLFANDPLPPYLGPKGQALLQASFADLTEPAELHELGMALFLDRPLGVFKAPGEPDQSLLLSHEAFSLFLAEQRLRALFSEPAEYQAARERLRTCAPRGVALPPGPRQQRPGVVSLRDADRAAPDFVFLRTTRQSVLAFLNEFDFTALRSVFALDWLDPARRVLLFSDAARQPGVLQLYDAAGTKRLELQADVSAGYRRQGGREFPAAGLRVLRAWDATANPVSFSGEPKAPPVAGDSPPAPR